MFIFAFLSLMIKEDAAIYVLSIALFAIFSKKEYKYGTILFVGAAVYFALVMAGISYFGKGLMDSHYGMYYLSGEKGVATMFKNMLLNPGLVLNTCFNAETIDFILYTLGVLIFLPIMSRRLSRLWLIVPYFLINLATTYVYQHDIGYQYVFGTSSLLMFLYITNVYAYPKRTMNTVTIAVFICALLFTYTRSGNLNYYIDTYNNNIKRFEDNDRLLARVPENASVTVSTFFSPHLYYIKEMYEYPNKDGKRTQYYILAPDVENYDSYVNELLSEGYTLVARNDNIVIFKAAGAPSLK